MSDKRTEFIEPECVALVRKNARGDYVRVGLSEFKNHRACDVRQAYTADDGKIRGTSKGVSLNIGYLDLLIDGLVKARELAIAKGWLRDDVKKAA